MIPYFINTERLVVRCWEESDADALKDAIDSSLEHLRQWMPWAQHEPEAVERKRERILIWRDAFLQKHAFAYGIFSASDQRLLGSCSIGFRIDPEIANFGYWIRKGEQGRGYVSEAVSGLTLASYFVLELSLAEIFCNLLNERSAGVPRRLGFQKLAGDHVRKTADGKDRLSQVWRLSRRDLASTPIARQRTTIRNTVGETLWSQ